MTTLRVRPEADRDLDMAAAYYLLAADLDVALRFLSAVEDAYERLLEHPFAGAMVSAFHPRLVGLRHWPVPGFEMHRIFFLPGPGFVEIVRLLHGARDLRRILGDRSRRWSDA